MASNMLTSPRAPGTFAMSRMTDEKNEYHQVKAPISTTAPPIGQEIAELLEIHRSPYSAACWCAAW